MKTLLLALAFCASVADAQPPWLFTPHASEIRSAGTGYRVLLDGGHRIEAGKFGGGWRLTTAGNLEIATYAQSGAVWTEKPGHRTWSQQGNIWYVNGPEKWMLTRLHDGGFSLRSSGRATTWAKTGGGWRRVN